MNNRFAVHVLMFDCEQFILRMIENCAPFVEKIYVAYSELPWTYNPDARKRYKNMTDKDILKKSIYFDKIELIEGVWEKEEDQRNTCLEKARADGFDYLIIHDADEFYAEEDYRRNLNDIRKNPNYDVYVTPWISFWKNLGYVVESKEGSIIVGYPQFAVNCKSNVKFGWARKPDSNKTYQLSGLCYHLSYAMNDEQLHRKINTWGHSHQFNSELWYRCKWLNWNESTKNLHPVSPNTWKRAIKFSGKLPEVLIGFESPKVVINRSIILDRILNFYYDQILLKSKAMIPLIRAIILRICGERCQKTLRLKQDSLEKFLNENIRHFLPSYILSLDDEKYPPTKRLIDLSLDTIKKASEIDLSTVKKRFKGDMSKYINVWPGEHYRLLAGFVCSLKPDLIIEIGTASGASSLAMKEFLKPSGKIISYDIIPWQDYPATGLIESDFDKHFEQRVIDLTNFNKAKGQKEIFINADFIFVDASKDGKTEIALCNFFNSINFFNKPIILFDDIKFLTMIETWRKIKHPKLDITSFGHWSGSGIVEWS